MKKVKTYMDRLMADKKFRKLFDKEYKKLDALAKAEKGTEKRITKKLIEKLKKGK